MTLHTVDIVLIVAYFVVMIGIGVYFSRKIRNIRDFFGGGGHVPWWLSGFSFYMTTFSAFGFVIYSQLAYKHGWTAITVSWMATLGALLSARLFAAHWRRAARTSALEFVEDRFGPLMRQGLVWLNVPLRTIDNGLKLFVIGVLVSGVSGFGDDYVLHAILFSGVIVFLYTVMGGLWAVLVTDFVQAIVMLAAVVVLLPLALIRAGGLDDLIEKSPEGFFNMTNETYTIPYLAAWVVLLALNYSSSWALVQRYYSVPTDADARKTGYLVAFLHFVVTPMMFLPAMAARLIFPDLSDAETEQVYALLCRTLLPVGMIGMLISAMFAATMSMISSEYNAIASVMTNDIYKRLIKPDASPRELVFVGRLTTVAIGALCIVIALFIWANPEGRNLFDLMVKIFALFLPPIAVPMIAGLISRRVSNVGGLGSLIFGMTVGLVAFVLSLNFETFAFFKLNQYMIPTTVGASLLGLIVGTLLVPSTQSERIRIDAFFETMGRRSRGEKDEDEDQAPPAHSPLPVIGFSIGVLGAILLFLTLATETLEAGKVSEIVGGFLIFLGGCFWWAERIRRKALGIQT